MSKKVILFWFHFNRYQNLRPDTGCSLHYQLLTGLPTLIADIVSVSSWRKSDSNRTARIPIGSIVPYVKGMDLHLLMQTEQNKCRPEMTQNQSKIILKQGKV
jgi:hypothetical protein